MILLKETFKKFTFVALAAFFTLTFSTFTFGQSLLGINGGIEGSVVVDNTTIATAGAANTWQKANATQTIAKELTVVRSGATSLRILNTDTNGRRVFSPLFTAVPNGSRLVLQYYRRRPVGTGQQNQQGIAFPAESLSGTYNAATNTDVWEKVTYVPTAATTTAGNKWATILHRLATGGNTALPEYLDDMAVYVATDVDNTAPNSPTVTTTSNPTTSTLDVNWTAASGGVDDGGYIVVRSTTDPATAPNVNGIYTVGNTVGTGTVVYSGTGTSFTDTGLTAGTPYFYRVYTFDKAYNYSAASLTNGTTGAVAPPSFAINDVSIAEGDTGTTNLTFTVAKTGANGSASTVNYATANDTATAGTDYTATSGSISFADGETNKTFTVAITGDYNIEPNETFFVNLTAGTNAAFSDAQGVGTITNDDAAGTVQFSTTNYSTLESGGVLSFTVTRTGGLGSGVTVTATTASGTATGGTSCGTAGVDYITAAPVLIFAGGETSQTFNITICNDAVFEDFENFSVALGSPTGGLSISSPSTATGTINNEDNEPTYTVGDVTKNEGNSGTTNFDFTVTKTGESQIETSIAYQTVDGTANSGSDYQGTSGTLTFAPGDLTKTITVLVNGDTTVEQDETFSVSLGGIQTRGGSGGLGTIVNDDAITPTVSLSITPATGSEAVQTTFFATATASSAVSGNQTVNFALTSGTAGTADFTAIEGTITIMNGDTDGSITFSVINDSLVEGPESATFTISSPSAGITLGSPTTASVSITDNDDQQGPSIQYDPLGNTTSVLNANIETTITDNVGVPTTGNLVPRVYYRKNSATSYVSNACVFSNNNLYNCTIDYSLVGGVGNGDSITYFIVAQDTSGNLTSNPSNVMGSDVNNLTMPPAAPNYYNIGLNSVIPSGTYSNLNTGSATLSGDVIVTRLLTVNGVVNNGNFTLKVDSFADADRISGYVIGNLTKKLPILLRNGAGNDGFGGITFTYPVGTTNGYSPLTATFTSFSSGAELSVFAKQGTQPNLNSSSTLQRYWTLGENGNITADLEFSYLQSDVSGTESAYGVIKVENGAASFYTPSSVSTMTNKFTASSVSNFSDWTLGSSLLAPTAADGTISGRITNTRSRGLENVTVTLSGGSLVQPIVVYTDQRGRYNFTEVPVGEIYTITVSSKRHTFNQPSTALSLNGTADNINFVGEGW